MKKLALFTLTTVLLVACRHPACANTTETYPMAGVVVDLDREHDVVNVSIASGLLYEFYGVEDWDIGDIAAMTMDDNGTETILDDKIVDARYAGWTAWFDKLANDALEGK